ncbi:MAG: hypothetical protein AUK47_02100 [Deltaproteobacteria bacterium CG2_30_63_29]|nr:MAG: hypothetical protein AUK47_02100 [Deltaproteobacteria bacterium CG2_30_63_29]PIW01049.1 MAG: Fe-S oxidoreductase [Deltaproteobacteria bacterium CG17_big_fil_post_rev_8_21_14_2_50_63_7]PJB47151.1 MAG: Fe-S oxidoreductase [Deltaproteobacteria bacterium CG_4_9_14_3_um_filter_63_12]
MPDSGPGPLGPQAKAEGYPAELKNRMSRPQRHRLLHGYPMPKLMKPWAGEESLGTLMDSLRPLIIGVNPHPFCNPKVKGCGFCTFPHQKFKKRKMRSVTDAVQQELRAFKAKFPVLEERKVEAVYLGGGTANLAHPDLLRGLYDCLQVAFDLQDAELTLEGVPIHFGRADFAQLRLLAERGVRQPRISMGVQTFDPARLKSMGRQAFGTREDIQAIVEQAQALGLTTSVDLLFNLPHQSLSEMLADLDEAVQLGVDQVCAYNLVLFGGLGTQWSREPKQMAGMRGVEASCENWLAVREHLLDSGFVQSTLTNFERAEVQGTDRAFAYERCSFSPETYDGLGFGPAGITVVADPAALRATKLLNTSDADDYLRRIDESQGALLHQFDCEVEDLKLLHLTRQLSLLRVRRDSYKEWFGSDPVEDFRLLFEPLADAELVVVEPDAVRLTPRGMFFADTVAGFLAFPRVLEVFGRRDENTEYFMG